MRRRITALIVGLAVTLLLSPACTPNSATCPASSVTLMATVTDDGMTPSALAVCRSQAVTLILTSETDAVFHIHGYDEQVPARSLEPGETTTLEFTADTAGQFIIELHAHSGSGNVEVGVLTVNEP